MQLGTVGADAFVAQILVADSQAQGRDVAQEGSSAIEAGAFVADRPGSSTVYPSSFSLDRSERSDLRLAKAALAAFAAIVLVGQAPAYAASFSCELARSDMEKLICSDATLSDMDSRMAALYRNALQNDSSGDVKAAQREWLRETRTGCSDAECMKTRFASRITELENLAAPSAAREAAPEQAKVPETTAADTKSPANTQEPAPQAAPAPAPAPAQTAPAVAAATEKSTPLVVWIVAALVGLIGVWFVFGRKKTVASPAPAESSPKHVAPSPSPSPEIELQYWDSVKNTTNPRELQAYLDRYPNGNFAELARMRIQAASTNTDAHAAATVSKVVEPQDEDEVVDEEVQLLVIGAVPGDHSGEPISMGDPESSGTQEVTFEIRGDQISCREDDDFHLDASGSNWFDPKDELWERLAEVANAALGGAQPIAPTTIAHAWAALMDEPYDDSLAEQIDAEFGEINNSRQSLNGNFYCRFVLIESGEVQDQAEQVVKCHNPDSGGANRAPARRAVAAASGAAKSGGKDVECKIIWHPNGRGNILSVFYVEGSGKYWLFRNRYEGGGTYGENFIKIVLDEDGDIAHCFVADTAEDGAFYADQCNDDAEDLSWTPEDQAAFTKIDEAKREWLEIDEDGDTLVVRAAKVEDLMSETDDDEYEYVSDDFDHDVLDWLNMAGTSSGEDDDDEEDSGLENATPEQRANRDFVREVVENGSGSEFAYAADELKSDPEFVKELLEVNASIIEYASPDIQADPDVVMAAVSLDGSTLQYAADKLRSDRKIVTAAVQNDGRALEFAADALKDDASLVMVAVRSDGRALEWASDRVKLDRDVVMAAVEDIGDALEYAAESLRGDPGVVACAVASRGGALEFALKPIHSDRKIVLAAVEKDGHALAYADEKLRADRAIVLAAVRQSGGALEHAAESLRADREIVLEAVRETGYALEYASDALRGDRDVVLEAVRTYGYALQFASLALRDDQAIVLAAVSDSGGALEFASDRLRNDRQIVKAAVDNDSDALEYASAAIKEAWSPQD